jgi:hypothetical protein
LTSQHTKRGSWSGVSLSGIFLYTSSLRGEALVASISPFYRSTRRFRDDHEDVNIYDRGSLLATQANLSTLRPTTPPCISATLPHAIWKKLDTSQLFALNHRHIVREDQNIADSRGSRQTILVYSSTLRTYYTPVHLVVQFAALSRRELDASDSDEKILAENGITTWIISTTASATRLKHLGAVADTSQPTAKEGRIGVCAAS